MDTDRNAILRKSETDFAHQIIGEKLTYSQIRRRLKNLLDEGDILQNLYFADCIVTRIPNRPGVVFKTRRKLVRKYWWDVFNIFTEYSYRQWFFGFRIEKTFITRSVFTSKRSYK